MIRLLMLPGFCVYALTATAQEKDTAMLREAVNSTIAFYTATIQGQTALYNGSDYLQPKSRDNQHPFFLSDDWVYGSVRYHGQRYENIPLLYDIVSDQLVTENYHNAEEIVLVNEKLDEFAINGHRFSKIRSEAVSHSLPATGFYEILYDGPSRLVVRHQKIFTEEIVDNRLQVNYDDKVRYFVLKNGRYFPVKTKASVLRLFAGQKPAVKQFLRQNGLRFGQNPAKTLRRAAEYYDTINGQ